MQILWIMLVCLVLLVAGTAIYDSNRFCKVTYEVESPDIKKNMRILFLSDLHNKQYGDGNSKLLADIEACHPDAVLVGGDILTATPGKDVARAAEFVRVIAERYPVYYANGNHEQRLELYPETYGDMGEKYEQLLADAKVKRLINEKAVAVEYGVEIIGCQIDRQFYKRFKRVEMPDDYLPAILPDKTKGMYTILLAHNPDYFPSYRKWGADLVLSGHVHGGVMRLPLLGGVIGTNFRLFPKYDGGKFEEEKAVMIVSRGLGAHTIPLRIWNPADRVEIIIRKTE